MECSAAAKIHPVNIIDAHYNFFFLGGGVGGKNSLPASHAITHFCPKKHTKKTQPVSRSSSILYLLSYMKVKANGFERVRLFLLQVFILVKNTGMDTQISAIPTKKKAGCQVNYPSACKKIHSFHVFPACRN